MIDFKARGWILTQSASKISFEDLQLALSEYVYIGQLEKGKEGGENGYEHYQIYIENPTPIRQSTLKNKLPSVHCDKRRGTKKQAYDYVTKLDTKIGETFGNGEIDLTEEQGKRNDLKSIVDMIDDGNTDNEIKALFPSQFLLYHRHIREVRKMSIRDKYDEFLCKYRENMQVIYIHGKTRTGKTRYVYETHGHENVYSSRGYQDGKWFDDYTCQDVLLLDEYRNNFDFGQLLKYTDGQPLGIQCRYENKVACYTKVYMLSNIPLSEQYKSIQRDEPESWQALLSRITAVYNFDNKDRTKNIKAVQETMLKPLSKEEQENLPF